MRPHSYNGYYICLPCRGRRFNSGMWLQFLKFHMPHSYNGYYICLPCRGRRFDSGMWLHFKNFICRIRIMAIISACHAEDAGSTPACGSIKNFISRIRIMAIISACHAEDAGSTPACGSIEIN